MTNETAEAADSNGHHLYAIQIPGGWKGKDDNGFSGFKDISDGKSFVTAGRVLVTPDTGRTATLSFVACAIDTSGKPWVSSNAVPLSNSYVYKTDVPIDQITVSPMPATGTENGGKFTYECVPTVPYKESRPLSNNNDARYTWTAGRSVSSSLNPKISSGGELPYSADYAYWAVDRNGILWNVFIGSSGGGTDYNIFPMPFSDYDFQSADGVDSSSSVVLAVGDPRTSSANPTVTQVPTTGAPHSDLIIPAVVVAAGMVVAGVVVSRRRRA